MDSADDDTTLLQNFVQGKSETAIAAIVQRHLPLVYSAALRQLGGDAHGAEDVAQLVFGILVRRAGQLTHHPSLSGWLYTTTYHVAAKARRSERRRRWHEFQAMQGAADEASSPGSWEVLRPILDEAMHGLAERDRDAVLSRFFENRSYPEIGVRLGLSENAARMRVERALETLQRRLARFGITSTAAALGSALAGQAVGAAPAALPAAIAAGALQASAGAGVFFLMSSLAIKIAVAAVAVSALAGVFLEHQTIARQQAQLVQLAAEKTKSESRSRDQLAELKGRLAAAKTAAAANDSPTVVHPGDLLRDHPEYRALLLKQTRRETIGAYAAGLAALNLPANKLARLKDLLTERRMANKEVVYAAEDAGLETGTKPFRQVQANSVQDLTDQIIGLIGADNYAQLQRAHSVTQTVNTVVEDFQPDFIDVGAPLTPDQLQTFSVFLHDEGGPHNARARNLSTTPDPSTWLSPADEALISQASAILRPTQLEAFKAHLSAANQQQSILASYGDAVLTKR